MKRLFDFTVALGLLVLTSPLWLVIVLIIRLESSGPAFYRQTRVGRFARPFKLWKFRSMVVGADQQGPYFTAPGDQRITKVGAWLRRTSLDELPQLLNVLAGQMSLVGPRPDVPAQRENYTELEWQQRCLVRPGITGPSQATLRSKATAEQRKAADLAYVEASSFWTDIKILLLTVKQILTVGSF